MGRTFRRAGGWGWGGEGGGSWMYEAGKTVENPNAKGLTL